jgi:hypothetical protein
MTPKQFLGQLRKIAANIEVLQEELTRLRSRVESTTVQLSADRVQTSPTGDRFADAIADLADKELYYMDMVEEYERLRQRIVDLMLGMDNPIHVQVLYGRYVKGRSLSAIANDLAYSYDRIKHVHGEALQAFDEKYLRRES